MPFSLTPEDSSFYRMFTASAENLVQATDVLGDGVHIEAAADLVLLTGLGTLPAEMGQQVALLQRCAQVTAESMPRLEAMKGLSDHWIEVDRLENQADVVETISVEES